MKKYTFVFVFVVMLGGATLFAQQPGSMRNHLAGARKPDAASGRPNLYENGPNQHRTGGPQRMERDKSPASGPQPGHMAPRTAGPVNHSNGPVWIASPVRTPAPVPFYRGQEPPRHRPAPSPVRVVPLPPPAPAPVPPRPSLLECLLHPIINLQFQL